MKLPLPFRNRRQSTVVRAAEDQTEKLLAEGLRLLSQFCAKMADFVESQRLARTGYGRQDKFLERLDYSPKEGRESRSRAEGEIRPSVPGAEETSLRR